MSDAIQEAKQEADDAYRNKQYEAAVAAYSNALELSEQQQQADLLVLLYSNRSAAKLALQDFTGALADAQASVAVNYRWVQQQQCHHNAPSAVFSQKTACRWLKGWFRSAKALQGLGKLDLAVQAASKAQELEPGNKDVSVPALLSYMSRAMTVSTWRRVAALMHQWLQCLLCRCECCCSNSRRSRSKASHHLTSSSRHLLPYQRNKCRGTSSSRQLCRNSTLAS